jgi:hypothetical protein
MEVSDVLAAIALVVSIFSAWVSYKTHRETSDFSERSSRLGFERERSEFLVRIDKSRKLFERAQHRINGLLAQIEGRPEKIKAALKREIDRLESDRDYLQGCLRQAWALWDETYEIGQEGFAHHKPRHLSLIEEDETFASEALVRADQSEAALNQAQYIASRVIG